MMGIAVQKEYGTPNNYFSSLGDEVRSYTHSKAYWGRWPLVEKPRNKKTRKNAFKGKRRICATVTYLKECLI